MRNFLLQNGFWLLLVAGVMSALDFALMGFDKRRAKQGGRRVRERTFFLVALPGGALGAILGMYTFRHKTRHWYFKWGLPLILLLQVLAVFYFIQM